MLPLVPGSCSHQTLSPSLGRGVPLGVDGANIVVFAAARTHIVPCSINVMFQMSRAIPYEQRKVVQWAQLVRDDIPRYADVS